MADATVVEYFQAARGLLVEQLTGLDRREIELRDSLDMVLAERDRHRSALTDVDQLIQRLTPGDDAEPPAPDYGTEIVTLALAPISTASVATTEPPAPLQGRHSCADAEIVRVCQEAHAAGVPLPKAVATATGRTLAASNTLITRLRNAGHPIPYVRKPRNPAPTPADQDPAAPPAKPTGRMVLACTEPNCAFETEVGSMRDLNTHTIRQHDRRPTIDERTPVHA